MKVTKDSKRDGTINEIRGPHPFLYNFFVTFTKQGRFSSRPGQVGSHLVRKIFSL